MSLDGRYDTDNIFAKIIRGEIPSVKVFEDERVLAFMDVFPQSRGHALVISKVSQARNLLEVEPEVLAELAAQPGGLGTLADLPPAVVKDLKELDLYELFAAPAAAPAPQAQPRNVREEVPA